MIQLSDQSEGSAPPPPPLTGSSPSPGVLRYSSPPPIDHEADQTFKYHSQALALLGIRTSVMVATVLAVPDAVALIPGSSTLTAWVLALVGCWTTALVLWFVFFVGFLHVMRILAGGIVVNDQGIRLWRLSKPISWQSIQAVSVEDERLFSRIFSYEHCVKRLTIFIPLKSGSRIIVPHYIPSFLFSQKQFDDLCRSIMRYKYGVDSGSTPVLFLPASNLPLLRRTHGFGRWQRLVVSLLIASGICVFMVRKAIVLYSYNEGLKAYREGAFQQAEDCFGTACRIEPTFAPAWHGMAGSEFNLGKFEVARRHWIEALRWKPDYVEAKVSLAYMSVQQRDFDQAEKLIKSALLLDPVNSVALLNRADLNMRTGHIHEAVQDAQLVISQDPDRLSRETFMATCLLAQAKLLQGRLKESLALLAPLPVTADRLHNGENLTYRLLVGAQTFLALNQVSKAEKLARLALQRGQNIDALLVMAQVRSACGDYNVAQSILERCRTMMPYNPWIYIQAAQVNVAQKKREQARRNLKSAKECRPLDPLSLSSIAHIYLEIGETGDAVEAARMSLRLEPVNPVALQVIEQSVPSKELN